MTMPSKRDRHLITPERAATRVWGILILATRTRAEFLRTGSPTVANRSLLSAPGNGFQEAETGGAETRKPRASAQPETQDLRNRRAKPLNRRAVWQDVQETRMVKRAWCEYLRTGLRRRGASACLFAFELLRVDGLDLRPQPWRSAGRACGRP